MTANLQSSRTEEQVQAQIEKWLSEMTLAEKVSLLSGQNMWYTVPVDRLGIPSIVMTDGPHGVRASSDGTPRTVSPATSFPTGVSMAASWDPELIGRVGAALAEETRALGCHILLGPCVNIVRSPLAGRNFESYSEDPYLAGQIGAAYVKGLQSKGIGASLKHFACNNQETNRNRGSSVVDERTLREIYLSQFETIVKEANPWTVMCSYNRVNGAYASENRHLLREILKDEWGFSGAVISDWGAVHNIAGPVNAGLDIEMPGPAKYFGRLLEDAVKNWQVEEETLDDAVRRVLRLILRCTAGDGTGDTGQLNTPEHQALARELAEESITLLKNENQILPLSREKIHSIAVIGPNAAEGRYGGGGSSFAEPPYAVSPLDGMRAIAGPIDVGYEPGASNRVIPPVANAGWFSYEGQPGLKAEIFATPDLSGDPVAVTRYARVDDHWWGTTPVRGLAEDCYSIRLSGQVRLPKTGPYTLILANTGRCTISIDGQTVVDNDRGVVDPELLYNDPLSFVSIGQFEAVMDRPYDFQVEFLHSAGNGLAAYRLMYLEPVEAGDPLQSAVDLAKSCDAAVIFAGMPTYFETEGSDRADMQLPGPQTELIRAVVAANPNTIMVLNAGAPVEMPWADAVPAIVEAYYPGQEGGNALARVLFGEVNPSGKLTVTFPKRLEDTPAYLNFPGDREVRYGEGIFVGYRYYDAKQVEPLFPFGHGLSYTTFEYSDLRLPAQARSGEPVQVTLTVKNTGPRAGKEAVQLYVRDIKSSLVRPLKELKGFQKVALQPGESQSVTFELGPRAFAFYHPDRNGWVVEPGDFEIWIGASSRDICLKGALQIQ